MSRPTVHQLVTGVRAGDRAALGRAITLVESRSERHAEDAGALLEALLPHSGQAWRIGVTGVPGVGKSTFIDAFGGWLVDRGHRVAVLAVDPSSQRTGGSILGDKTRMQRLSVDPAAFVRPSPAGGTLGGVASHTREALIVVEAAGYDVVLVETVGVGQSELAVADMTDFFLVLMLAGAGDELQGIKRGLMELADLLAVNKADGDNALPARKAAATYRSALHLLHHADDPWTPRVQTCSGLQGEGLEEIWQAIEEHRRVMTEAGRFETRRRRQRVHWLWDRLDEGLRRVLLQDAAIRPLLDGLTAQVEAGLLPAPEAARRVLQALRR
ncbi:MAG: methylmalonyl Co-A mutase-associated GTPase MeaB [Alphaproteobacteria bacterium]|nr:methylmalonyl Co-A mutase-associated GTPase MeaB [Alphaproteobacteria bacterium]